jgi:hypothetical protein
LIASGFILGSTGSVTGLAKMAYQKRPSSVHAIPNGPSTSRRDSFWDL